MVATDYAAPISEARLHAILRLYLHLAHNPIPMVNYTVYLHDVGDLLAEVSRLRAAEEDRKERAQ